MLGYLLEEEARARSHEFENGLFLQGSVTGVRYVACFAKKANITLALVILSPGSGSKVLLLTKSSPAVDSAYPAASILQCRQWHGTIILQSRLTQADTP